VVFDPETLPRVLSSPCPTALCIDRNIELASEEVRVSLSAGTSVAKVSKDVLIAEAVGGSIGSTRSASTLLASSFRSCVRWGITSAMCRADASV
jgi:choline kinase